MLEFLRRSEESEPKPTGNLAARVEEQLNTMSEFELIAYLTWLNEMGWMTVLDK